MRGQGMLPPPGADAQASGAAGFSAHLPLNTPVLQHTPARQAYQPCPADHPALPSRSPALLSATLPSLSPGAPPPPHASPPLAEHHLAGHKAQLAQHDLDDRYLRGGGGDGREDVGKDGHGAGMPGRSPSSFRTCLSRLALCAGLLHPLHQSCFERHPEAITPSTAALVHPAAAPRTPAPTCAPSCAGEGAVWGA